MTVRADIPTTTTLTQGILGTSSTRRLMIVVSSNKYIYTNGPDLLDLLLL